MKFTLICERSKEERDSDMRLNAVRLYYNIAGYGPCSTTEIQVEYAIEPTTYRYKTLVELVTEYGEDVKIEHTGLAVVVSVHACNLNALLLGAKCDCLPPPEYDGKWAQWDSTFVKEE